MTFKGNTPLEEVIRQISEAFTLWNQRKARMATLLDRYNSSQKKSLGIHSMTLPECTNAVVANPQEGIYA
ncbi:MAG: hypothetical protein R3Y11_02220 [Pseudomonadota bacterium]